MLASVVFAGASHNHKLGQAHPALLTALGYVVVGSLIACVLLGIGSLAGFAIPA